jgi:hypothetical protein
MNERTPFYDLETAARVLAEIFRDYDLGDYLKEREWEAAHAEFTDYHAAKKAVEYILGFPAHPANRQRERSRERGVTGDEAT